MRPTTPEHRAEGKGDLREATPAELTGIDGGRMNLGNVGVHQRLPLVGPDGEPIDVYVDGLRVSRY